jgi:hypothetical protein
MSIKTSTAITATLPAITYEWDIAGAPDIDTRDSNGRLTVRPRTLKVHAGGRFRQPGEMDAYVEGQRVIQSSGELGGLKSASFTDRPRYSLDKGMATAPAWVGRLVHQARRWEAARAAVGV